MPLATCPECQRHVKVGEATCPFCNVTLPLDMSSRVQYRPPDPRRFGRAALVSFSAVIASATAACGSDDGSSEDVGQKQGQGDGTGGMTTAEAGVPGAGGFVGTGGEVGQPVYGIPVDPPMEPMPQPEYGVSIDFDAQAPGDNPVSDAGADADNNTNPGPLPTPVYGIPIDRSK